MKSLILTLAMICAGVPLVAHAGGCGTHCPWLPDRDPSRREPEKPAKKYTPPARYQDCSDKTGCVWVLRGGGGGHGGLQ